jgi:Protein of unknown function (DUF3489)
MKKPTKRPPNAKSAPSAPATAASHPPVTAPKAEKAEPTSKQARVIAMLRSPAGATVTAMMKATGWQQHSVRGFLAGVVRKRLKLKLASQRVDATRVYRIANSAGYAARQPKRRSA